MMPYGNKYLKFQLFSLIKLIFREIDGHHEKINNADNVPCLPACFYSRTPYRKILDSSGHACKQLPKINGDRLSIRHKDIDQILSNSILRTERFNDVFLEISQLNDSIGAYSSYLMRQFVNMEENHSRTKPLDNDRDIIDVPASNKNNKAHLSLYKTLNESLECLANYEPLNLHTVAPDDPRSRYRWILGISLNVPVQIYKIKNKSIAFIWKIDKNDDRLDIQKQCLEIVQQIDRNIPFYHTRAMKRKATQLFMNDKHWTNNKLTQLYNLITGGETNDYHASIATIKDKLETGMDVSQVFEEEETEQLDRKGKFENFFQSVDSLINDHTTPHERRHGTLSYISPLAPSLRALMEMAIGKMAQLFPNDENNFVPSFEWFRRQFSPRNVYSNVSKTFTGRFDATRGIQQRLLRKSHPDHHYGAKQLCYFKEHAAR